MNTDEWKEEARKDIDKLNKENAIEFKYAVIGTLFLKRLKDMCEREKAAL